MVKIKDLYSLKHISECYYINDRLEILNNKTEHIKTQSTDYRGYKYVTLNGINNKQFKVFVHKIVALAFIKNAPYKVINHKNGVVSGNHPYNLEFTTTSENIKHAYRTGIAVRDEKIFKVITKDNYSLVGTIKELSEQLHIPRGTLYDNYYFSRNSKRITNISIL